MRNLMHILLRLLHNWMSCLLLGMEDGIFRMLRLKVGMLHQKLGTLVLELRTRHLHRSMTREWSTNKLTGLQKAGPSVASEILAHVGSP
jgi:hypothetical protein